MKQPESLHPPLRPSRPEILAPAGDPAAFRAALAAGADAVYLGLARFNARGRADRFRDHTLEACLGAAHEHGARVYVTLNTLLHDDELPVALELAAGAHAAGADAVIVQDPGLAAMLRAELPDLPLHGSTQMTVHQPDQAVEAASRLGLKRVILARECTLHEVAAITRRLEPLGAQAEVFVHGALCFAYSGQCLMSNFAGRRSANRGICAQNCRFDYTSGPVARAEPPGEAAGGPAFLPLPVFQPKGAVQLISMKDLAAFESVAALADAGVGSFKIEGRLKGPSYVAEVVRLYRAALDAWEEGKSFSADEARRAAGRVYSRGFTNGYLAGTLDPSMRGDKRSLEGEPDAIVLSAHRKSGVLHLEPRAGHELRAGQGYRYVHDRYRGGFRVLAVDPVPTASAAGAVEARVRFGSEATGRRYRRGATGRRRSPPPLPVGLALYLNDDPELEKRTERLVRSVELRARVETIGLRFAVYGRPGEPLRARVEAADGRAAESAAPEPLETSRLHALDRELLEEHLGRLGGTAYRLESVDASGLDPRSFLRFPALHELRRDLVARLDALGKPSQEKPRSAGSRPRIEQRPAVGGPALRGEGRQRETALSAVVGTPGAFAAALAAGARRVVIEDPALLAGEPAAAERWRTSLAAWNEPWFRLPPIVHDQDADRRAIEAVRGLAPRAGILAGHWGQLALAAKAGLCAAADLYLNAYNHRTVQVLAEAGARRVTLSLEVDAKEAASVSASGEVAAEIEVVAGGAVYSMLTRQDYGLGASQSFLAVSEHGHAYRFESSPGGITVLYEARELVGAEALPCLAGRVDAVRLDLAHQPAAAVSEITAAYRSALDALQSGADAAECVARAREAHERHAPAGSFAGHLFRGARLLDQSGSDPAPRG